MDGATLQSRIYAGYARAAAHVGTTHALYRPAALAPALIGAANQIGTIAASFNIAGTYNGQTKPDQIIWQAVVDGTQVQVGDYLVGENTFCIVGMQPLMPILAMRCTDTMAISRMGAAVSGADGASYGLNVIAAAVPCYIQLKRDKGFSAPAGFQGGATNTSAPLPEWNVYACLGGVTEPGTIQEGDIVTFSNGDQMRVDAASSSTIMWQLACTPYKPHA